MNIFSCNTCIYLFVRLDNLQCVGESNYDDEVRVEFYQAKAFPCSAPCVSEGEMDDVGGGCTDGGEESVVDGDEAPDSRSLDIVEELYNQ